MSSVPNSPSPIADLSYRDYNGPLESRFLAAWVIAKAMMRQGIKKRGFLTWAVLSAYWYFLLGIILFFVERLSSAGGPSAEVSTNYLKNLVWKEQYLVAFNTGQILYLILALMIGLGTIANDVSANALLVYFSKPLTKREYVFGKWLGIFIPLFLVAFVPAVIFYMYGVLSYRSYGFFSQDPTLLLRLAATAATPAVFHASVGLGFSSLFNQGRFASATYAGVFFFSLFFTKVIQIVRMNQFSKGGIADDKMDSLNMLFHFSIDGLNSAVSKLILGTPGPKTSLFPGMKAGNIPPPPVPNPALFVGIYVLLCVVGLAITWNRVRAVEVVG